MRRLYSALACLAVAGILCALTSTSARAVPTINNPVALGINVNGVETLTDNSQFIFRAQSVTPSNGHNLINLGYPGMVRAGRVAVVIQPYDPANPEGGGSYVMGMVQGPSGEWFCYVSTATLAGLFGHRTLSWSIVAREDNTDGTFNNGIAAAPKPAANTIRVVYSTSYAMVPVDQNYQPDKRATPGQWGNGLRVDPEDPTAKNDGGSAHIYTWRIKVWDANNSGIPPQLWRRREFYEWRDWRYDPPMGRPWAPYYNTPVLLVLTDPSGTRHYCPMEPDPQSPTGDITFANTYTFDTMYGNRLLHPTGGGAWSNGVYFRFRMVPVQYEWNWGPLPGEGPFTAFGGPTQPDLIPAIPIGNTQNPPTEVFGRPLANQYASFAGNDGTGTGQGTFPWPRYTITGGRSGQWSYYYVTTSDLRPVQRAGFPANASESTYPDDPYGRDPDAYMQCVESDTGLPMGWPVNAGSPSAPYVHPFVSPILSDGAWTDDLPENGYASSNGQSHRSRPTNKTKVRFMCRVTKADNSPLPAGAVRVWVDNTVHTMEPLPVGGNSDYLQGIVFYADISFTPGQEGQHWTYFEIDDGIHKAIWPRRDSAVNGTGDARYTDPQSNLLPTRGEYVAFGTGTVGKNYLNEPLVNHRPVLSGASVTPTSGVDAQPYTYEVTYQDGDNDEPLDAWVVIDGQPHRMSPVDTTPTSQGRRYRFTMTFLVPTPDSKHTYYFRFRDNWNTLVPYGVSVMRREFGEWSTLPQGDDNGVPASVISGPIVVSNKRPQLVDVNVFYGDPAQTPATLWDFVVRYKDADNDPPTYVKLFLSNDDGATWDGGTALVKAEASSNYTAGVQYHLPNRIRLPYNATNDPAQPAYKYRYRFVTSDAANHPDGYDDTVQTTMVHVGTGVDAIAAGTARTLAPVGGSNAIYADPAGTRKWYLATDPLPADVLFKMRQSYQVWKGAGATPQLLTYGAAADGGDYTVDAVTGQLTLNVPNATGDLIRASYYYTDTVGPVVNPNRAPTLTTPDPASPSDNFKTLQPLQGGPTTSFTYTIIYTDADNQAPTYVNLLVDTQTTIAMTMDPATPVPADYTRGVKYNVTVTGAQLGNGTHNYHFEASDGADVARIPKTTDTPGEYAGPSISNIGDLNLPPIGSFVDNPIVPFPKGKSTDNYIFTVVYKNSQGLAPVFPVELRVKASTGQAVTAITMQPIDPIGPNEYMTGVRFQTKLTAPAAPLTPGTHEITFGLQGQAASTVARNLIVNGPPVLSQPLANPVSASAAGDITFSVVYTDLNGDAPQPIKLLIDGVARTEAPTSTPASPTAADLQNGVLYTWTYPANTFSQASHTFQFTAQDDLEQAQPLPQPAGSFTVVAASLPELLTIDGSTNGGTLTPLLGGTTTQYTYSVKYRHADGVTPVTITVTLDPNSASPKVRNLVPPGGVQPTPAQIQAGVVYTYQTQVGDLAPGTHQYKFGAADRLASVNLPATGQYDGPTVNFPPALSVGTVYPVGATSFSTVDAQNKLVPAVSGNVLTKFVFQVVLVDPDHVAGTTPTVTVKLNNAQTIPLSPTTGDYSTGMTFTSDANGIALTAGTKNFHFEASDGTDNATFPVTANTDISGLTVYNIPQLLPVNATGDDGTLSPRTGPLSAVYTYSIVYQHADNTAPASVKVYIDGTAHDMTKVGTSVNYAAGVTYQFQFRFPNNATSTHNYRFEAQDTVSPGYTANYPANAQPVNGPTLNVASFSDVAFNPNPGIVGAPVTVTGTLTPAIADALGVAIQLVRPDGTGVNDSVVTNTNGTFSYTFTPNQTGDWRIRLSWGGVTGQWDPITQEFPQGNVYKVKGYTIQLSGGQWDLVSSPMVPVTPDPSITFNPTAASDGSQLPITAVNLTQWSPSLGKYLFLNQDGNFPGITGGQGYWMRPTVPGSSTPLDVIVNPRGKLWDQSQTYSIPLAPGWNMIGSVFLTDINWSAVKVLYGGQVLPLTQTNSVVRNMAWGYNPSTHGYVTVSGTGVLSTGRGYWVKAADNCTLILPVPGARSVTITRDVIDRANSLQVVARCGGIMDTDNFVPVTGATADQVTLMEKPPYPGDFVTVHMLQPGSVQLPAETRAADAQSVTVFEVATDHANTDVTVEFPNASLLSRRYEATLVDLATNTRRALGTNAGFTYNTGDNTKPRRFALLFNAVTQNSRLMITDLRSAGRAQGAISFTYNITASANVQAQVLGANGRVVRSLGEGRSATRGINNLNWDGKDSRGVALPAGTYMLKLTATDANGRTASAVVPVTLVR